MAANPRIEMLQEAERRGLLSSQPALAEELRIARMQGVIKGQKEFAAAERTDNSLASMRGDALRLKSDLQNARAQLGDTTQLGRAMLSGVPMTGAYEFDKALTPIRSNAALSKLAELKANSPTGASGFGSLTAPELDLLVNSMGSLDVKLPKEQIERSLANIEKIADRILKENPETSVPPAPSSAPGASTTTADTMRVGTNPLANAVDGAAGATTPEKAAAYEAGLRQLFASGADKATLEKFAADNGQSIGGVDDAIAARDSGDKRLNVSRLPDAPVPLPNRGKDGFVEGVDAGVRGAADVMTLGLADEIAAIGSTIANPETTLRANLDRERATDRYDEENNFGARLTGQLAGGFALPLGAARTPVALGKAGAGYGAAYGFGSGEGLADRAGGAALGGVTGGALGYGSARVLGALAARTPRGGNGGGGAGQALSPAANVVLAGERQGIDVPPALTGARAAGWAAGLEQGPFTGPAIQARNATMQEQARDAQTRIAGAVGAAVDPFSMGTAAARGAEVFKDRTNKVGASLYDAARQMAGQARPLTTRAVEQLSADIDNLSVTPGINKSEIEALQTVLDDLSIRRPDGMIEPKYLPIDAMRGVRTQIRALGQTDAVRATGFDRKARMAVDAVSEDIVNGLKAAGKPEAAAAFRKADRYWRQRLETIDQVLTPIVGNPNAKTGPKAPEAIVQAINNAAAGNSTRLAAFVRALPAEESAVVRATMIDRLGVPPKVAEGGADEIWSLQRFLTSWRGLSERSKSAIFDPASRSAINDLATVAREAEKAGALRNFSNTARAATTQAMLAGGGGAVGMAAGGAPMAMITFAASVMGQQQIGRLMASPRFARRLAGIAKAKTPGDLNARIAQLSDVAEKERAIAPLVTQFQGRLSEALQQQPASLAATEQDDK